MKNRKMEKKRMVIELVVVGIVGILAVTGAGALVIRDINNCAKDKEN